jgi:predicted aminopeptidase
MNLQAAIVFVLATFLSACSTLRFYSQALNGQTEMMSKARPVAEVLKDPKTKPILKECLLSVAHILRYAEDELRLPAEGQYSRYADLGRRYAVWVVFAAPEFSVEPKTWNYPLIGQLAYRGFFQEALAKAEAENLNAEGYDVHIGGVEAYSTLGFLRDPLLNTFIHRDDAALAELLFHELTHQRLYLRGDTDFNEAFATAVGQEGARRWLRSQGRLKELAEYEKGLRVEHAFVALALQTREELKRCYATKTDLKETKKAILEHFRQRAVALDRKQGSTMKIERWFAKPVNNARLATLSTYYELLPGFEALLTQNGGDLEKFFKEVEAMKHLPHRVRTQRIRSRGQL